MEGSPMTLTEFLLARIAEDEAVARLAESRRRDHLWVVTGMDDAVGVDYDPARLLAECEAKRRIVRTLFDTETLATVEYALGRGSGSTLGSWQQIGHRQGLEEVVSILAAVYSDHPDYRQEWKP